MDGPPLVVEPTSEEPTSDLMTSAEAAAYIRVRPGTLASWRFLGRHRIPYIKAGNRFVRYRRADLDEWIKRGARYE